MTRPAKYDVHNELRRLVACDDARKWANGKTEAAIWRDCPRGDWLLWWAAKCEVKRQTIVRAACDCARLALSIYEARHPGDLRPRKAIETAEAWTRGKATLAEVQIAAAAAAAAAAYADAAYTDAAYAAAAAAYYAASAAAAYADSAAYAAAVRSSMRLQCADVVRARIKRMPRPKAVQS